MSLPSKIPRKKMTDPKHIAMFKLWLDHGADVVAKEYNLNVSRIHQFAYRYGWRALKQKLAEHKYNELMTANKIMASKLQQLLQIDLNRIIAQFEKEANKSLAPADRDYVLRVYDRILKEVRLDDGKPTELPGEARGVVTVRIEVPEGVQHLDAIPPIGQGEVIEVDPSDAKKVDEDEIDVSELT